MQYARVPVEGGGIVIQATGPIIAGDVGRLTVFLRSLPASDQVLGYALDSPGGEVGEAEKLANFVHLTDQTVAVLSGAKCASACFLIFAAAPRKLAAPDALIGVHSASDAGGDETLSSLAATTLMSRDLAGLGVPSSIIAKVVETEPNRMEWLMPRDLALLGAQVITPTPRAPQPSPTNGQTASAARAPAVNAPSTNVFDQGLADRRRWEAWLNSLPGAYHEGARYWSAQRSLPKPGSCFGPAGQNLGDWTSGCLAAQQLLAPTDIRRKSEPEYRLGWNSY
jgi:ATP-dependent protease ClpP protease subunit